MIKCEVPGCIYKPKGVYCEKRDVNVDDEGYCKSAEFVENLMRASVPVNIRHDSGGYKQNNSKTYK